MESFNNLPAASIDELLERFGGMAFEKQLHLNDIVGTNNWNVDMTKGEISFGGDLVFPLQVIGTFAYEAETWLWAWANERSGLSDQVTQQAWKLKEYGETNGISLLTEGSFEFSRNEMHIFGLIASGMFDCSGYYLADYGQGVLLATIQSDKIDSTRESNSLKILTAFPQLISQLDMSHKNALRAYLQAKGYSISENGGKFLAVERESSIEAEFDGLGRLVNMEGKGLKV